MQCAIDVLLVVTQPSNDGFGIAVELRRQPGALELGRDPSDIVVADAFQLPSDSARDEHPQPDSFAVPVTIAVRLDRVTGGVAEIENHPQAALATKQMAGGGPLIAFEVKGDKKAAFRFTNALRIFKISNNLGDAKSLITHPATTTHQRLTPEVRAELGIFDNSLRVSIGLEDVEDLKADLEQALAAAK